MCSHPVIMSASSFDLGATARGRRLVPRSRRPHLASRASSSSVPPPRTTPSASRSLARATERTDVSARTNERRDRFRFSPNVAIDRNRSIDRNQSINRSQSNPVRPPRALDRSIASSPTARSLARSLARPRPAPSRALASRAFPRPSHRPTVPPSRRLVRPSGHGTARRPSHRVIESSIGDSMKGHDRSTLVQYGTYMDIHGIHARRTAHTPHAHAGRATDVTTGDDG